MVKRVSTRKASRAKRTGTPFRTTDLCTGFSDPVEPPDRLPDCLTPSTLHSIGTARVALRSRLASQVHLRSAAGKQLPQRRCVWSGSQGASRQFSTSPLVTATTRHV